MPPTQVLLDTYRDHTYNSNQVFFRKLHRKIVTNGLFDIDARPWTVFTCLENFVLYQFSWRASPVGSAADTF
jgi:hypothetical protein